MKETNKNLIREIFGVEAKELYDGIAKTDPEFMHLIEHYPIERVWARKGLPLREKSLLTIASQIAVGRWDQVEIHMKSFQHLGGTKEELREISIHLSVYCGFPAALNALKIARGLA